MVSGDLDELAVTLAQVGRTVRDALLATVGAETDRRVVRRAGGDEIYGLDDRADQVLVRELERRCARWPGRLVMEGPDTPLPVGDQSGPWTFLEDRLMAGVKVFRDPAHCTGGLLMGLADGADTAVLDVRPLVGAPNAAHPYDLAAIVVARAAGVIVEALPPGPLGAPLDPWTPVAWAGYCNTEVADAFRQRWNTIGQDWCPP
jgi:hypothetical protein